MELYYKGMSEGAKRIADFISHNTSEASAMTSRELGEASGTGAATVIRYARSLGFSGFEELKNLLSEEIHSEEPGGIKVENSDRISALKNRIVSFDCSYIKSTVDEIGNEELDEAASAIFRAEHVQLVAMGGAAGVAISAVSLFNLFGIKAEYHMDDLQQSRAAARLSKGDVLIGINYSGSFRGLSDSFLAAHEGGAKTILISGAKNSSISRYADIVFLTPVINTGNKLNIPTSMLCQTSVIQMILVRMWQLWPEELSANSERIGRMVRKKAW